MSPALKPTLHLLAQTTAIGSSSFLVTALQVAGWVLFACFLLVAGLKLFDLLTPGKLHDQVFGDRNVAASVVYGSVVIALAIIIASALH